LKVLLAFTFSVPYKNRARGLSEKAEADRRAREWLLQKRSEPVIPALNR